MGPTTQCLELHDEEGEEHLRLQLMKQVKGGMSRSAGSKQIIHEHNSLTRLDAVAVNLKLCRPVLQLVGVGDRAEGELPFLTHGDESNPQLVGEGRAKNKSPCIKPDDLRGGELRAFGSQTINGFVEERCIFQQWGQIPEENPLLGEVGDGTDPSPEICRRHTSLRN